VSAGVKSYREKIVVGSVRAGVVAFAMAGDEHYAKTAAADAIASLEPLAFDTTTLEFTRPIRQAVADTLRNYLDAGLDL
jgi:hypothetical protein